MANIKKNFNFRNGVQVDDDNLLVTSTGLVGIGTTVPSEALDVRGNVNITGFCSFTTANIGIMTISTIKPTEIIGAGVSIKSGIVTAEGAGIVTYYGDARFLQGMPTSQWADIDVGLGFTSIYNTGGNVGIATTDPRATLQVGGDVDSSQEGVGISSVGNIKATGIVTASSFVGNLTGDVTGRITGDIVGNINSAGVSTFNDVNINGNTSIGNAGTDTVTITARVNGDLDPVGNGTKDLGQSDRQWKDLYLSGTLYSSQLNITGISTAVTLDVNGDLDVDGHANIDNLSVAGVSTFSDDVVLGVGATVGIGSTVFFDNGVEAKFGGSTISPGLRISNDSSYSRIASADTILLTATGSVFIAGTTNNSLQSNNNRLITGGGVEIIETDTTTAFLKHSGVEKLKTTDGGVLVSGIITATTELNSPLIGVGTDTPANDIQVRKSGNVEIQVTSDTGVAGLTLGREPSTGNTNNAEFRYGGVGLGANYSSAQSLDIINYGTGNFNYHLSAANAGNVDGDFHWHKGVNNTRLMTLTGIGGSLGIGITTPSTPLHVLGAGTISGDLTIGGDINPVGSFNGNVVGDVTGILQGNVNATSGVSTFFKLDLDTQHYYTFGELSASAIGIGATMGNKKFLVNTTADTQFTIGGSGNVGIKTDNLNGNALFVNGDTVVFEAFAVGKNQAGSAVDFSNAGQNLTGVKANRMYMIPPKVGAAQTAALVSLVSGAMIYNTNLNKLQVYNGTNWETITSVEVTG